MRGIFAPVVTPFCCTTKGHLPQPDIRRFLQHCQWLIKHNVNLAIFGTNSEANSMTIEEKKQLLHALVDVAKITPKRIMVGAGACAAADAIVLADAAVNHSCGGILLLPPFYYKNVKDDGLFRYFASVIEGVGQENLRVYLYHIPQIAGVGISMPLIERLLKAFPKQIAGIKDSAADWSHTNALIKAFSNTAPDQSNTFQVFAGSETYLLRTLRAGGAGCISATANVNPKAIAALSATWEGSTAQDMQAQLDSVRKVFGTYPLISAMKAALAHWQQDAAWETVRPPLTELPHEAKQKLLHELQQIGFEMEKFGTV